MASNSIEMDSIVDRLEREIDESAIVNVMGLEYIQMDTANNELDLTMSRQPGTRDQLHQMLKCIRDKKIEEDIDTGVLDDIDFPRGVDGVKYKWYWAIAIKSYQYWFSLSDYFGIEQEEFNEWVSSVFTTYNDDISINQLGVIMSNELFSAWLAALRLKENELDENNNHPNGTPIPVPDTSSTSLKRKLDGKSSKKSSSNFKAPIEQSHMPDVWGYSESYFELQNSIKDRVMEYLIYMGYEDAAEAFLNEGGGSKDVTEIENDHLHPSIENTERVSLNEVFANWGKKKHMEGDDETNMKHHSNSTNKYLDLDFEEILFRKTIRKFICSGRVEEALQLLEKSYPEVLKLFPSVKYRLKHLELVERIKDHLQSNNDQRLDDVTDSQFLEQTLEFIHCNLSDAQILNDKYLVSQMEDTMTLLCIGKRGEVIPERFSKLLSIDARKSVAKTTNDALLKYNYGKQHESITDLIRMLAWSFGSKISLKHTANIMLREHPGHLR